MKVILIEDVKSLGKKGEIVNVSDGYARNMLFPKKLGVEANAKNINDLKLQKAHEDKVAQEVLAEAKALAEEISKKEVTVSIKVGEGGKTLWFRFQQGDRGGCQESDRSGAGQEEDPASQAPSRRWA